MIEVKNLTKSFDKVKVLEDLNFTIKDEAIYGLIGANGAGKSTLLRIINDIYNQDAGEVLVDGVNVKDNQEIQQNFVFVPDDLFFYPSYTVLDTAEYYKALYKNFDMEYFKKLMETLKLDLKRKVNTFSKGMKKQLAISCALSTNAKYIFLDETFDGLDPVVRNLMKKLFAERISEKKATILMTSHNLRELEDICDCLGLLFKGKILFESDINTLKTNIFKVQVAFKENFDKDDFKGLDILNFTKNGSVATIITKGKEEEIRSVIEKMNPIILDFLTLTLEEIFIYEMEVLGYEFNSTL